MYTVGFEYIKVVLKTRVFAGSITGRGYTEGNGILSSELGAPGL